MKDKNIKQFTNVDKFISEGHEYNVGDIVLCKEYTKYSGLFALIERIVIKEGDNENEQTVKMHCSLYVSMRNAITRSIDSNMNDIAILNFAMVIPTDFKVKDDGRRFMLLKYGQHTYRAKALKSFTPMHGDTVMVNDLSGIFSSALTLSQNGTNWISYDSSIHGSWAKLRDNAYVGENSSITGNCKFSGNTVVLDAIIDGNVEIGPESFLRSPVITYNLDTSESVIIDSETPMLNIDIGKPNLNAIVHKSPSGNIYYTTKVTFDDGDTESITTQYYRRKMVKELEDLKEKGIDTMKILLLETMIRLVDESFVQ